MQTETAIPEQDSNILNEVMGVLGEKINRWTLNKGNEPTTTYNQLSLHRLEAPLEQVSYLQEPALCLIVQGKKCIQLGEEEYYYDKDHYVITAVDLPLLARISGASKNSPYLGLTLKLEKKQIAQILLNDNVKISRNHSSDRGLVVSKVDVQIVEAILRLVDLLDHPGDMPILAPLIQKEILYRLLTSEQGRRLQQISMIGSHSHQIARAIEWLKENYDKSFKVEDLATYSGMSTSSLHYHFRTMTAMSPLQFQKRLRLNEARQRMLMEQKDATTAAFEVGYESPSQFSREYSRLFGAPPSRDIKRLLEVA